MIISSKFLKWNMITRSVFLPKVGTSMKSPKCSIEMMGYHSLLLFNSQSQISCSLIFFSASANVYSCNSNLEKLFLREPLSFVFVRLFTFNFMTLPIVTMNSIGALLCIFSLILLQQWMGSFFCFCYQKLMAFWYQY